MLSTTVPACAGQLSPEGRQLNAIQLRRNGDNKATGVSVGHIRPRETSEDCSSTCDIGIVIRPYHNGWG